MAGRRPDGVDGRPAGLAGRAGRAAARYGARRAATKAAKAAAAKATAAAGTATGAGPALAAVVAAVVAVLAILLVVVVLIVAAVVVGTSNPAAAACVANGTPGAPSPPGAIRAVDGEPPARLIPVLTAAVQQPGVSLGPLGPAVLAAVAKVESDFGTAAPGRGGDRTGPFQLSDAEWATVRGDAGADADGDGRVRADSFADAAFALARLLQRGGAPGDWQKALLARNPSTAYAAEVMRFAQTYAAPPAAPGPSGAEPSGPAAGERTVGASMFGGAGDPGTGHVGYKGDDLNGKDAFAELGYSTTTNESNSRTGLLGNLPYRTALVVTYGLRQVVAFKLDIGRGGGNVGSRPRAIDLWHETARKLGFEGLGLVRVRRADGADLQAAQAATTDAVDATGAGCTQAEETAAATPPDGTVTEKWGGVQSLFDQFIRPFMTKRGLPVTSQKRPENSVAGGKSDHWVACTQCYAIDFGTTSGADDATALARAFGVTSKATGTYARYRITYGGLCMRLQILWAVPGHYDHVHVGARRCGYV